MAEVYVLTFPNGKQYVGRTKKTTNARFRDHAYTANHGGRAAVHNAIRRYGAESVEIRTLVQDTSWPESASIEIKWIARLNTMAPNGYNLTAGGEGKSQCPCSEATKARISAAKRGKPLSLETRTRMSQALKGNHHVFGHRWRLSLERRQQIGEANHQRKMIREQTCQESTSLGV